MNLLTQVFSCFNYFSIVPGGGVFTPPLGFYRFFVRGTPRNRLLIIIYNTARGRRRNPSEKFSEKYFYSFEKRLTISFCYAMIYRLC